MTGAPGSLFNARGERFEEAFLGLLRCGSRRPGSGSRSPSPNFRARGLRGAALFAAPFLAVPFLAVPAGAAEPPQVSVELNKLEAQGAGCRAFLVVANDGQTELTDLKLDFVLFQPDGVIGRRFIVNLAPLKAQKRSVKQFDLEGTACDQVGSLLINDIIECESPSGMVENCLAGLTVKSLTKVQLTK